VPESSYPDIYARFQASALHLHLCLAAMEGKSVIVSSKNDVDVAGPVGSLNHLELEDPRTSSTSRGNETRTSTMDQGRTKEEHVLVHS
jgi:hypothetical protein